MSAAIKVVPDDPKAAIMHATDEFVGRTEVFHNQVLIGLYLGPEKSQGGIFYADIRQRENEYQGKVGVVLKIGPLAFKDDDRNKFEGQKIEVGDWVAIRPNDGWPCRLGGIKGVPCRMVEDVHVKMRLASPDDVY